MRRLVPWLIGSLLLVGCGGDNNLAAPRSDGHSPTASVQALTSSDFPNLPAGYVIPSGFQREFNATTEGAWSLAGSLSIVDDGANPGGDETVTPPENAPASPENVGKSTFPAGWKSGLAPTNAYIPSGTVSSKTWKGFYFAVVVQLSSNWDGEPSTVNKVMFVNIHGNPCNALSATGAGDGGLTWQIRTQNMGLQPPTNYSPNLGNGTVTRGLWQRVEVQLVSNTPGQLNGIIRMWLTNYNASGGIASGPTKIMEYTNVGWSSATQSNIWDGVQWQDTWGGNTPGATVAHQQEQWMDRIAVAGHS